MTDEQREFQPDKRDECGCHRECTTTPHLCRVPCVWPKCLTVQENIELMRQLDKLGW